MSKKFGLALLLSGFSVCYADNSIKFNDVIFSTSHNAFIAVADNGVIETSSDGMNWRKRTTITNNCNNLQSISEVDGQLYVASECKGRGNIYRETGVNTFTFSPYASSNFNDIYSRVKLSVGGANKNEIYVLYSVRPYNVYTPDLSGTLDIVARYNTTNGSYKILLQKPGLTTLQKVSDAEGEKEDLIVTDDQNNEYSLALDDSNAVFQQLGRISMRQSQSHASLINQLDVETERDHDLLTTFGDEINENSEVSAECAGPTTAFPGLLNCSLASNDQGLKVIYSGIEQDPSTHRTIAFKELDATDRAILNTYEYNSGVFRLIGSFNLPDKDTLGNRTCMASSSDGKITVALGEDSHVLVATDQNRRMWYMYNLPL